MSEWFSFDEEYDFSPEDMKRLSKAAERVSWRKQAQEELEELGDFWDISNVNVRL
ncbi:hypothetical protein [Streptomyces sp. NBC_01500]|uniref:hypothetical protein n=1 Tax=Streptomyces sp. NBC_01500 TaxID=2903886 RepID=UPI00225478AD|nr:hypothetical protein [Streptomyces sp. NBC_01500]MCX4554126.1 hypothetical protein [Streptomyces sp. NBC_01500]